MLAAFFALGVAYLALAAVVGAASEAAGSGWGRWLALHLAFVGGVSQLVLGASQFFVGAFLATGPPSRRLVRGQLVLWNAGALAVAVGVPSGVAGPAEAGGALLVLALGVYALGLRSMQRRSLQRARWAVRWYFACAALLAPGLVAGILLARGTSWAGGLLGAHLALNLGGWFGTAIVGTLHTFLPSLTQTRLSFPRLEPATFVAWIAGVAALALGYSLDAPAAVAMGWGYLLLAALCLGANVVGSTRVAQAPLALPARLLITGQALLVCGLIVAIAAIVAGGVAAPVVGPQRVAIAALLLADWLGLTVLGSLLHLLSVLVRVRAGRSLPRPSPARDRAIVAVAAAGVVALAVAQGLGLQAASVPAAACVLAVYGLLGARVLALTWQAAFAARPGI